MSHTRSNSQANNHRAQLANAYQELGKELGREKLKIVGGYTLGRVIGEGTYGSVHIATHRLTATRCAIKKIPKTLTSQLTREIHHHRLLHHPNILHLHEVLATETHIWLVSELCTGGELFDYLVERGRLLEGEGRRIFGELAVAVGLLHKKGTVHRDLKLENVLLDGECKVKLGDLGFAREWVRGQKMLETFCGTTGYASPEVLKGQKYNGEEADIWSLGIILYTLLCGGLPFDDDDEEAMKGLIYKGEYEEPDWLSLGAPSPRREDELGRAMADRKNLSVADARHLIRSMLQLEPTQRISIKGILSHAWFNKRIVDPPLNTVEGAHELAPDSPYLHAPDPPDAPFFNEHALSAGSSSSVRPALGVARLQPIPDVEEELLGPSPLSSPKPAHAAIRDPKVKPVAAPPVPTSVNASKSDSEGAGSEASFDFLDSSEKGRSSSVSTSPTTADGCEAEVQPVWDSGLSASDAGQKAIPPPMLMAQSNSSEATIRKVEDLVRTRSNSGAPPPAGHSRVSALAQRPEDADQEGSFSQAMTRSSSNMSEDSHVHLPVAARSRTPSRTKRRSMSSLPETRPGLGSHLSWSLDETPIVDYLGQLEATPAPYFTTRAEKEILDSLELLGFDTGQLKHSVNTNACDPSAALWWMLRIKQNVKAEAEREALAAMPLAHLISTAAKIKPTKGKPSAGPEDPIGSTSERSSGAEKAKTKPIAPAPTSPSTPSIELGLPIQFDHPRRPSISPDSRAHTIDDPSQITRHDTVPSIRLPLGSTSSPDVRTDDAARRHRQLNIDTKDDVILSVASAASPSSPRASKGRSASFTMLQRATTALTSSGVGRRKSDEKILDDVVTKSQSQDYSDKPGPNKLLKSPVAGRPHRRSSAVMAFDLESSPGPVGDSRGGQGNDALVPSRTVDSFASTSSGYSLAASTPSKPSKDKTAKRDGGLLTTFKSWFEVDKRKRRRAADPMSPHPAPRPTSTYGSNANLRSQHVHAIRKTTTVMAKRVPSDGRPALHSRRSSSANSRRSSITSTHIAPHDTLMATHDVHALSRRHSRRSAGSRTPTTSEHDHGSRPSSIHSFHMHGQASTSVGMHSNMNEHHTSSSQKPQQLFPTSAQSRSARRHSSGQQRRTTSGATSTAQSVSSRRSSGPDFEPDLAEEPESEADASHDDAGSTHSRQRRRSFDSHHGQLHPTIIVAAKRNRSPRVTQLLVDQRRRQSDDRIALVRPKAPLRDVFASTGDDDWISDEEQSGGFSGGLGQLCSGGIHNPPPLTMTDSPTAGSLAGGRFASSVNYRNRGSHSEVLPESEASTANVASSQAPIVGVVAEVANRRANRAPFSIGRPADIREEEEEEEEDY